MPTQLAMFNPVSHWKAPKPEEWFRWADADCISVDLECKDEDLKTLGPGCRRDDSYIAGVGIAIDKGPSIYVPIAHHGGDNIDNADAFWAWMEDNAANFKGIYSGGNCSYDLDWLLTTYKKRGASPAKPRAIKFSKTKEYIDVLIWDCLIYELHKSGRLDAVAERWAVEGKNKALLVEAAKHFGLKNPLAEMWKLPARYVGPYNLADLRIPLELIPKMLEQIKSKNLERVCKIEGKLIPILVAMRQRGIRVNETNLSKLEAWSLTEERAQIARVKELTGIDMSLDDFTKGEAMARVLEKQDVRVFRNDKGKPTVDEEFLTFCKHPVAAPLLRGRQMDNLRNKFSTPTFKHLVKGRIHCVYNQVRGSEENTLEGDGKQKGARTGRMSAEHTNMTQQPSRQDWAPLYKEIFEPEEGKLWCSNDYSQQEPRLTTHYASILNLAEARNTAKAYREDPLLDNHTFMSKLTGIPRKRAKNVYLGLVYAMGEAKLCRQLGLPTQFCVTWGPWRAKEERFFAEYHQALAFRQRLEEEDVHVFECAGPEGKTILKTFHERAPFLKQLMIAATKNGRKYGEIVTLMGRILHLPIEPGGKYGWIHKCLNMLIQGSAADQMKQGMIDVVEQMPDFFLQLQVHDMLGGSCNTVEEAKQVGYIMRNTFISEYVPFRVDTAYGENWGKEKEMCYDLSCMKDAISKDDKFCPLHAPRMAA